MTLIEWLLLILILVVIGFALYYFFRGSSGRISLSHPVESRVDEYLDRRFEDLVQQWSLVTRKDVQAFSHEKEPDLVREEARMAALLEFKGTMEETLANLEARLDALEKKGKAR
jgi:hypothetical protein